LNLKTYVRQHLPHLPRAFAGTPMTVDGIAEETKKRRLYSWGECKKPPKSVALELSRNMLPDGVVTRISPSTYKNNTPRKKARKLDKDIKATLDDPATGFDIGVLRRTYINNFGPAPNTTDPIELRDLLIDAALDEQIAAGIDSVDIIRESIPKHAFNNLLRVIELHRDELDSMSPKRHNIAKKRKACVACRREKDLLRNPDGTIWCSGCWDIGMLNTPTKDKF